MKVIGLTGGIASGKSTVSAILRELGAKIIDADLVVRDVEAPGSVAWREIVETFGRDILFPDGKINRKRLGEKVFGDAAKLAKLNRITHPRVVEAILQRIDRYRQILPPTGVVVVDAPLLIESGMTHLVDEVWLVVVDPQIQLERLMQRDHYDPAAAKQRLNAQLPVEEKKKYAHRIIDNNGSFLQLKEQVLRLWAEVVKMEGKD